MAGVVGQLPPSVASSTDMHSLLTASGDASGQVPSSRWTFVTGESAARYGVFAGGTQWFDNRAFSISPAEVSHLDPQQRWVLEASYTACIGAKLLRAELLNSSTGAFLGIMNTDYTTLPAAFSSAYAATGGTISIASGRLSFALGLIGPAQAVDTACSSAVVALHGAVHSIWGGDCEAALTMGVNMILSPLYSVAFATARMLSVDGRCKTFDACANGYARGEGVGALFAGPALSSRAATFALCGSAVMHGGRAASLTAPNGGVQFMLLSTAFERSMLTPDSIEAHGTGTALGDPTEIASLLRAVCKDGGNLMTPSISSAKAHIGHLEPSAGVAGLARAFCSLAQGHLGANAQLRLMNPMVAEAFTTSSPHLPQHGIAPKGEHFGLSSFGYSGTIAHTVIGKWPASSAPGPAHIHGQRTTSAARRLFFAWSEPSHPLRQRQLQTTEGGATFCSPVKGALRALVADHIVRDSVVFPGAQ